MKIDSQHEHILGEVKHSLKNAFLWFFQMSKKTDIHFKLLESKVNLHRISNM